MAKKKVTEVKQTEKKDLTSLYKIRSLRGMGKDKKGENLTFIANTSKHLLQFEQDNGKEILLEQNQIIALTDSEVQMNSSAPFMSDGRVKELDASEVEAFSKIPAISHIDSKIEGKAFEWIKLKDEDILKRAEGIRSRSALNDLRNKCIDANKSFKLITALDELINISVVV